MKKLFLTTCALVAISTQINAASLSITLDQDSIQNNANGTLLTLNFGNSTDGATSFGSADFVSRAFTNLNQFGPSNLTNNVGAYPETNLDGTVKTITGTVTSTGAFNFGFKYSEDKPGLGFTSLLLERVISNRMRGPAMWTAIDGFFPNFYVDSVSYSSTGTAADFTASSAVPLPAGLPLLVSGLAALGFARRRKGC